MGSFNMRLSVYLQQVYIDVQTSFQIVDFYQAVSLRSFQGLSSWYKLDQTSLNIFWNLYIEDVYCFVHFFKIQIVWYKNVINNIVYVITVVIIRKLL